MIDKNEAISISMLIIGISLVIIGISDININIKSKVSDSDETFRRDIGNTRRISNFSTPNFSHPNMYLNTSEIEDIKNKIIYDKKRKNIYDKFMIIANNSLNVTIQSVTFGGEVPPSGDIHDYWTEVPYISDGITDPDADRNDNKYAIELGKTVRNLGLAYALTEDNIYADKAIQLINGWTIDPETKMNPKFTNGQSYIDLSVSMPSIFYGADLIWNYPGWNKTEKNAFKLWTKEMINSAKNWSRNNNFENWRIVFIGSASVVAEDGESLKYSFDRWKDKIEDQVNPNGLLKYEITRTNSLIYSTFAINAMIQTAEIARHYNIDLYNYKLQDGRGLELVLDFHIPYIMGEIIWPFPQKITYSGDNAAIYELAYSFKQKPSYKDVIDKWKRPMFEMRVLGPVTLTHANEEQLI